MCLRATLRRQLFRFLRYVLSHHACLFYVPTSFIFFCLFFSFLSFFFFFLLFISYSFNIDAFVRSYSQRKDTFELKLSLWFFFLFSFFFSWDEREYILCGYPYSTWFFVLHYNERFYNDLHVICSFYLEILILFNIVTLIYHHFIKFCSLSICE